MNVIWSEDLFLAHEELRIKYPIEKKDHFTALDWTERLSLLTRIKILRNQAKFHNRQINYKIRQKQLDALTRNN